MKVKRRFPNFFTGFEATEHEVSNYDELIQIDWIKHLIEKPAKLSYSKSSFNDTPSLLMATDCDNDSKYFVVGYIYGNPEELGLTDFNTK